MKWKNSVQSPAPGKEEPHAGIQSIIIFIFIDRSKVSRWREVNTPLYSALLSPAGIYPVQLFGPKCKEDINCSEAGLVHPQGDKVLWGLNNKKSLWRDYWEDGAGVFTTVYGRRKRDNVHKWQQQRFRLDKRKKTFSPWGQSSSGTGCPGRLCSLCACFEDPAGSSPEQPDLTSQLTLLWAGGWTGGLLNSLPAWIMWLFCDSSWFPSDHCYTKDGSWTGCVPACQGIPVRDISSSSLLTFCYKEGCGTLSNLTPWLIVCDSPDVRHNTALIATAL